MSSPPAVASAHRALGLTDREFDAICRLTGRTPNGLELAVFSLMWSEHCAYKHSRRLLAKFRSTGPGVVLGPGENAGAVDIGFGQAVVFKVESHNHPSAVEPFEGAATGVGGILRDIFALGARPIAILDSLRFGTLESARSRYLLERAVDGIGHYGNSIGVPTVGGEIHFDGSYERNCLVNAMCVGIAKIDDLKTSAAKGVGNALVLLGASTGRDGIGGASVLASAELGESEDSKRPSVQIGDPFEEKKLLECCLELVRRDLVVSLQDLGAAGLSSSVSEMAAKGRCGIDIDVSKVPLREASMEPFEIMISESQERMAAIVEPSRIEEVAAVAARHEVRMATIGTVTEGDSLRVFHGEELLGEMPVDALVDQAPTYDLEPIRPTDPLSCYPLPSPTLDADASPAATLTALLGSENIADRRAVFEQYDSIVQSRTVCRPGTTDAAVLKIDEAGRGLAVTIDGNGRRVASDPYRGAAAAVLEAARNLACVGAEPVGLTNCLNFGNPEKPHIAWQLERAVSGMADAATALEIPVVSGNVSLYNEAGEGPIFPTPVVGMVGTLPDVASAATLGFRTEGDYVALLGPFTPSLAGSEVERLRGRHTAGLPEIDLGSERETLGLVREAVRSGTVRSAHDVAEGGLAVCLAECAVAGGLGCDVDLAPVVGRFGDDLDTLFFGEGSGIVVTGAKDDLLRLSHKARSVGFVALGRVTGADDAEIVVSAGTAKIRVSLVVASNAFNRGIPGSLNETVRGQ